MPLLHFNQSKQRMKKLVLMAALFAASTAYAQYEEGFESFAVGDFICVESELFDPWPGGSPGSEWDAQVSDEFASDNHDRADDANRRCGGGAD